MSCPGAEIDADKTWVHYDKSIERLRGCGDVTAFPFTGLSGHARAWLIDPRARNPRAASRADAARGLRLFSCYAASSSKCEIYCRLNMFIWCVLVTFQDAKSADQRMQCAVDSRKIKGTILLTFYTLTIDHVVRKCFPCLCNVLNACIWTAF